MKGEVTSSLRDFRINRFYPGHQDLILLSHSPAATSFLCDSKMLPPPQGTCVFVGELCVFPLDHLLISPFCCHLHFTHWIFCLSSECVAGALMDAAADEGADEGADASADFLPLGADGMELAQEVVEHVHRHQVVPLVTLCVCVLHHSYFWLCGCVHNLGVGCSSVCVRCVCAV